MPPASIDLSAEVHAERTRRRQSARDAFDSLLCWLEEESLLSSLSAMEAELMVRLMALGVALVALWLAARLPQQVPRTLRIGSARYVYRALAGDAVRTRFGQMWAVRPVYTLLHGRAPATLAPQDGAIGLAAGRMSLGVYLTAGWLAARMSFDDCVEVTEQFGQYAPSKNAVMGIVDQLGPRAQQWLAAMPAPDDDGDILVIQTDSKGAPMISSVEHARRCRPHQKRRRGRGVRRQQRRAQHRERRRKGKRSKNAKMSNVAVVYTLRRLPDGTVEGPLNKRIIATFQSKRRLFELAKREAVQRGYGNKPSYFLADGDPALWKLKQEFFSEATGCIDWYHVCEYLWPAGTAVYRDGSPELQQWVQLRKAELMRGELDALFDALRDLHHAVRGSRRDAQARRQRIVRTVLFLFRRRHELRYQLLDTLGLDIATGAIEGAINYVVGRRLDGSMMRWSPQRAEYVLALRCVQYNAHWSRFAEAVERTHTARASPVIGRISPQQRQQPYDAVRKAA